MMLKGFSVPLTPQGKSALVTLSELLKAPIAHTSRAKDFLEPDNPFNIGMTGLLGTEAGYNGL